MPAKPRLSRLAQEWDADIFTLIKLAREKEIQDVSTPDEVSRLRRAISGYYNLSNHEIRTIEAFLETAEARAILDEAVPLLGHMDDRDGRKYLEHVAELLFRAMPDEEFKARIRPATVLETVLNLGVLEVYRSGAVKRELPQPPYHLLRFDPAILYRIIVRQFQDRFQDQRVTAYEDFRGRVRPSIDAFHRQLKSYAARETQP